MRRFEQSDLAALNDWNRTRGDPELPAEMLPHVGYVEPGIAAGFLYSTDAGLCLLENFVSCPSAGPKARNEAVESITDALLDAAKACGFKHVLVICRNSAVRKRAERRNFHDMGYFSLMSRRV